MSVYTEQMYVGCPSVNVFIYMRSYMCVYGYLKKNVYSLGREQD